MAWCFFISFLALFITKHSFTQEKVLIISHHCIQPFFVELQAKTFKKFLKDDYEFVIFNDAKLPPIRKEIDQLCSQYGIRCIRIDPEIHFRPYLYRAPGEHFNHPSIRTANVIQYSLDELGFDYPGLVIIIDSDMFMIQPFSFLEYMKGCDLAGVPQNRNNYEYIWNGLVMMNMKTLPDKRSLNFNCGLINQTPVDTGGYTFYYLSKYKALISLKWVSVCPIANIIEDCKKESTSISLYHFAPLFELDPFMNMEILLGGTFLHYRSGGKWDPKGEDYYEKKNEFLKKYIRDLVNTE